MQNKINAVILSDSMPKEHASYISRFVNLVCEEKPESVLMIAKKENRETTMIYSQCSIDDLRVCADTIEDEAIIRFDCRKS